MKAETNQGGSNMKKVLAVAFALVVALTCFGVYRDRAGYDRSTQGTEVLSEKTAETKVYSFSGSDEVLTVMNGTVILGEDEETFSGGILQINSEEFFEGVTSYNTTFYILEDGIKKTVMSNSLVDRTGGKVKLNGDDLGKISGADIITEYKTDNTENLINNLYFEINTVGADGESKTHQLRMDVVEIN